MPTTKYSLQATRKKLQKQLKSWIPNNNYLVNKELKIFDHIMNRRDFLKTTSLAALTMMINQGCQDGTPSQWDIGGNGEEDISNLAKASVTAPSNIAVDADIHSSFVTYNPLPAYNSSDCSHVKGHAIIESFNPHIMSLNSTDELSQIGFNLPHRTYGIPEHVNLAKDSTDTDYYLEIYEKSHDLQHGLKKSKVPLNNTSTMVFNSLIATNGTFHNKASDDNIYGQKLALLANVSTVDIDYNDTTHMQLYYQTNSSKLLEPSIEAPNNSDWKHIDVIDTFKKTENHTFENYKILDANVYHDGHHHSFIYGTISFDTYYYYGFVITFNTITDAQPSITFFTPEFLSYKSNTLQNFKNEFDSISNDYNYETNYNFEDLSLFLARNFQPLAQAITSDGNPEKQIYFSFATLNLKDGYIENDGGSYDLSNFIDNSNLARYMISVDTTQTIDYLLSDYEPTASIEIDDSDFLNFIFDTSSINAIDLWENVYDKDETLLFENFVRSIHSTDSSFEVLLASSYYNQSSSHMGLAHKSILIENDTVSTDTSYTIFEDGKFLDNDSQEKDYKALWHNDMKSHLGGYDSLYETVFKNNGMQSVQFHCAHNHQGLLRSYYIIRNGSKSLLIGFNEKGIENDNQFAFQNHNNLKNQIQSKSIEHYPPMPIAINPKELLPWHGIAEDGEILFSSMRQQAVDSTSKKLVENNDANLLSYMHSSCNLTQKNWNIHEEKVHFDTNTQTNLVLTDLHQIHLHVTNIYRHPVSLYKSKNIDNDTNKNIFVEVRFNKRLRITDYTDSNSPKTYHPGANNSIFLSTDKSGRISLEIDVGNKNDKYNGAQMEYRLVDKSQISQQTNTPTATFKNADGTTNVFKKCNISFKMYQRLSSDYYAQPEVGIKRPNNKTIETGLKDAINNSDAVSQIADGYAKLSQASSISPDNDSTLVSLNQNDALLFSFSSKLTHFHPISWIKHTTHSALNAAQKALEAAKKVLNRLANSIDNAIKNIVNDTITAIEDMAAAVEKLWEDATSFAKKLWDYLMALLDLETAYDIGKELIQLRYDQLKPISNSNSQNQNDGNIYTLLENAENLTIQMTDDVKSKTTNMINDIFDNNIFQTDELISKLDTHRNSTKSDHKIQQNNSTKITHIMDQLSRLKKLLKINQLANYTKDKAHEFESDINTLMKNLFNITLEDMFSGASSTYLENTVLKFFKVDTKDELLAAVTYYPGISKTPDPAPNSLIRKIQNNAVDIKDHVQTFVSGTTDASDIAAQVEKTFKNTSLLAINSVDEILEAVIKMPTEFLKDDKILEFMTNSGPLLNKLLQPLGLLLFQDTAKFKNIEDVAAFNAGFAINIAPLLAQSAYNKVSDVYSKNKGEKLDLATLITDGTLRTNLNRFINLSHKVLTTLTSQVITVEHIESIAKEIAKIMLELTDKVLFKVIGIIIDFIGLIIKGLEKITGLINKIPPIKDPIFDALAAIFHVFTGAIQLFKIQPQILNVGVAIADYTINKNRTIADIVLMSIQTIFNTLQSIGDTAGKICEAIKAMGKGQPGEVITNDPLRIALISIAGFIIARLSAFIMDFISMVFKFSSMGYDLYQNGLSDFLKDLAIAGTVILELLTTLLSSISILIFLFTEILGYIVKSTDIELIVAGAETIALPVAYAIAWILYLTLLITDPIVDGLHSLSSFSTNVVAFAESEV